MAEHVGLDFLRVVYGESAVGRKQLAAIADLAAGLGIERRLVEHHDRFIARLDQIDPAAFLDRCARTCPSMLQAFVAVKLGRTAAVCNAFLPS